MMKESIYEIRFAKHEERDLIIDFYKKYWNPNHALVKSVELLDFQHKGKDFYNILIAINKITNEIDGTWGLIPVAQFDSDLDSNGNYWGGILKVRDDITNPEIHTLFFKFYKYVLHLPGIKRYISSGLGEMGQKMMLPFNKYNGILNQYYIANNSIDKFKYARNLAKREYSRSDIVVKEIDLDEHILLPTNNYSPQKSVKYFINRFKKHPIYHYRFWGIYSHLKLVCIWAIRVIDMDSSRTVIRIVDSLGNFENLPCIGNQIQALLSSNNAEYADFLNAGISESVFNQLGFIRLNLDQEEIIVPNYFEPFVLSNVPIHYAYNSNDKIVIFKADSDQDRPNIV